MRVPCHQPLCHGAMPFANATIVNGMSPRGLTERAVRADGDDGGQRKTTSARAGFPVRHRSRCSPGAGSSRCTCASRHPAPPSTAPRPTCGVHGGEPPRPRRVRHAVQPRRFRCVFRWRRRRRASACSGRSSTRCGTRRVHPATRSTLGGHLDWHGDHPHANFHRAYDAMRAAGYFVRFGL